MLGLRTAALAALILADVAPSGSCGRSSRPTQLALSLSNCSCVPGTATISLDDAAIFTSVRCPFASPEIPVSPGRHVVRVTSGSANWSRNVDATSGQTTSLELGCPTP